MLEAWMLSTETGTAARPDSLAALLPAAAEAAISPIAAPAQVDVVVTTDISAARKAIGTSMMETARFLAEPWLGVFILGALGAGVGALFGETTFGAAIGSIAALANCWTGIISIPMLIGAARLLKVPLACEE
jgi:hypothetical protein